VLSQKRQLDWKCYLQGYDVNSTTNVVSNRQGVVDDSCQPDATGRQVDVLFK